MRDRSIDNFLTNEEKKRISVFIEKSLKRFMTTNNITRTIPEPLSVDDLQKIFNKKHSEWDIAVKTQIPNTSDIFLNSIRNSDKPNPCAIENFLKSLKILMDQEKPPHEQKNMLEVLERDLLECGYGCPCPAEG